MAFAALWPESPCDSQFRVWAEVVEGEGWRAGDVTGVPTLIGKAASSDGARPVGGRGQVSDPVSTWWLQCGDPSVGLTPSRDLS